MGAFSPACVGLPRVCLYLLFSSLFPVYLFRSYDSGHCICACECFPNRHASAFRCLPLGLPGVAPSVNALLLSIQPSNHLLTSLHWMCQASGVLTHRGAQSPYMDGPQAHHFPASSPPALSETINQSNYSSYPHENTRQQQVLLPPQLYLLWQKSASCASWARSGLLPVFENKVVLEHGHVRPHTYCLWLFLCYNHSGE